MVVVVAADRYRILLVIARRLVLAFLGPIQRVLLRRVQIRILSLGWLPSILEIPIEIFSLTPWRFSIMSSIANTTK